MAPDGLNGKKFHDLLYWKLASLTASLTASLLFELSPQPQETD